MRQFISSGSTFEALIGYSRAVVDGDWIFVSGTTGFDYGSMTISDDVAEQAKQALKNIDQALTDAGATRLDIVRVHYILPDTKDFEACWPSSPLIPTPTWASMIILTSLAPSPMARVLKCGRAIFTIQTTSCFCLGDTLQQSTTSHFKARSRKSSCR